MRATSVAALLVIPLVGSAGADTHAPLRVDLSALPIHAEFERSSGIEMGITLDWSLIDGWIVRIAGTARVPTPPATASVFAATPIGQPLSWIVNATITLDKDVPFSHAFYLGKDVSPAVEWWVRLRSEMAGGHRLNKEYAVFFTELFPGVLTPAVQPILYTGDGPPFHLRPEPPEAAAAPINMAAGAPIGGGSVSILSSTTMHGKLFVPRPADGVAVPCSLCYYEVWDRDIAGDEWCGSGRTEFDGSFSISVGCSDTIGGPDPFFWVKPESPAGWVYAANGGSNYWARSVVPIVDGCSSDCAFDTTLDLSNTFRLAYFIHNNLAEGRREILDPAPEGPNYDIGQSKVRFPVDNWEGHGTDVAYFDPITQEIRFSLSKTSKNTHSHEHGHFAMFKAYGSSLPGVDCETGIHYMPTESTQGCAWVEGWAHYFSVETHDNAVYEYSDGTRWNLEDGVCTAGSQLPCSAWQDGDDVEGRVARSLWDIVDSSTDEAVQRHRSVIWDALRYGTSSTFGSYYNNWVNRGCCRLDFDRAAEPNTINYYAGSVC